MSDQISRVTADQAVSKVPILNTKLHQPKIVSSDILPRNRLLEELNDGFQRTLTLISAPAGYGKSTLASLWLESCDCPSGWISLDDNDNDLRVFLTYLMAAIQRFFPEAGKRTKGLLESSRLPPSEFLRTALVNDLDDLEQPCILVLDDYHSIHDEAIHDLLNSLLRFPSPKLHLVLLTRRDPPLMLHLFRARAQMNEIVMDQLRFTPEETAEFLQKMFKTPIDEKSVALLREKTEGWVTGLRLVALSLINKECLEKAISELTGGFYNISRYFINEILSQQTPEIAQRLLDTSILDRFCVPLCERLELKKQTEESDKECEAFIEWLEKANLFVIPLDLEHHWFRYHHLFQELLQSELRRRKGQDEIARLHQRVSEWFVENGFIEEAIKHALKAGDEEGAAGIVENNRDQELIADRWYVLERWLAMLPTGEKRNRPKLLLTEAWILNMRYQMSHVFPILEEVETLLSEQPLEPKILGELAFFQGYFTYFSGQAEQSRTYLEEAVSKLSDEKTPILGEAELMLGLARCMEGQKEVAVETLNSRLEGIDSSKNQLRSRLIASLAFIYLVCSDLPRARDAAERFHYVAKTYGMRLTEAWSCYMWGLTHLHAGEFEAASLRFDQTSDLRYALEPMASVDALAGLALTQQLMHLENEATETTVKLERFVHDLQEPQFQSVVNSCRARIALLRGDVKSAIQWAQSYTASPTTDEFFMWCEVPSINQVRVLITSGSKKDLDEAARLLPELRELSQECRFTCQTIEIAVLHFCLKNRARPIEPSEPLRKL